MKNANYKNLEVIRNLIYGDVNMEGNYDVSPRVTTFRDSQGRERGIAHWFLLGEWEMGYGYKRNMDGWILVDGDKSVCLTDSTATHWAEVALWNRQSVERGHPDEKDNVSRYFEDALRAEAKAREEKVGMVVDYDEGVLANQILLKMGHYAVERARDRKEREYGGAKERG